jgi:hypothetical protein
MHRRGIYCFVAVGVVLAAIIAAWMLIPHRRGWLLHDQGPVQGLQGLVLAAATVLALCPAIRSRFIRTGSVLVVPIAYLFFALAWREIEFDKAYFGVRAFSWAKLLDPDIPLGIKLMLQVPTLAITLGVLVYLAPRLSRVKAELRAFWREPAARLLCAGLVLLAVSQVWDNHDLMERLGVHEQDKNPLPEELLELTADGLLAVCANELRLRKVPTSTQVESPEPATSLA